MSTDQPPDQLDHPFADPPPAGTLIRVREGIGWARMALPFALDHVNVWLLDGRYGRTVVDTGVADDTTRAAWRGLLRERAPARVLATHFHPDHVGLAGWLCDEADAPLLASRSEWLLARLLSCDDTAETAAAIGAFYRRAGLPDELRAVQERRIGQYRRRVVRPPAAYHRLQDGAELALDDLTWRVITAGGHAPEHVSLYCEDRNVLIAGDQVLPRISPNVSVVPSEPMGDPLGDFLDSLERFASLPDDCLVLPSHGLPFVGLHRRRAALRMHHEERLALVERACTAPRTAHALMATMFDRELDPHQTMFAVGEVLAHVNHLLHRGRLRHEAHPNGDRYTLP